MTARVSLAFMRSLLPYRHSWTASGTRSNRLRRQSRRAKYGSAPRTSASAMPRCRTGTPARRRCPVTVDEHPSGLWPGSSGCCPSACRCSRAGQVRAWLRHRVGGRPVRKRPRHHVQPALPAGPGSDPVWLSWRVPRRRVSAGCRVPARAGRARWWRGTRTRSRTRPWRAAGSGSSGFHLGSRGTCGVCPRPRRGAR